MKVVRITQAATGVVPRIGAARDAPTAVDVMASAAGYRDGTGLLGHLRAGGLHVEDMEARS